MELKEFVENILVDLDAAVDGAREATNRDIKFAEGENKRTIEFDIAVSIESSNSKNGKAGVRVLEFAEAGGDLSATARNSTVSRVTFGLRIESLTKAERDQINARVRAHNQRNELSIPDQF